MPNEVEQHADRQISQIRDQESGEEWRMRGPEVEGNKEGMTRIKEESNHSMNYKAQHRLCKALI